jgi:hypothetical protein
MSKITTNELAVYAVDQLEVGVKAPALAEQLAGFLREVMK